ncbi:MAG TPA: hypothetical protein VH081_08800 [Solirubrobacteraceae bacterium]|jgi:hypothetical protein|nr:hypothetical protein [Solirubrobacteraceae bacterium]
MHAISASAAGGGGAVASAGGGLCGGAASGVDDAGGQPGLGAGDAALAEPAGKPNANASASASAGIAHAAYLLGRSKRVRRTLI